MKKSIKYSVAYSQPSKGGGKKNGTIEGFFSGAFLSDGFLFFGYQDICKGEEGGKKGGGKVGKRGGGKG